MKELKNNIGRVVEAGKVDFLQQAVDEPGPDQVVIRIVSSAICGSDLHIFKENILQHHYLSLLGMNLPVM